VIELRGINKAYREKRGNLIQVLQDINLQIKPGTFAAISGPSGCGKSTLLLISGSLLQPDQGQVIVNGEDFTGLNRDQQALRRAETIGFVFQRFHLLPYLTVRDNILAATVALPHAAATAPERADELMTRLGLTQRSDHLPGELSVGEMQRTALARALLNQPKVILADEPTGNLDPENAEIVLRSFTDFAAAGGTVLMVTHSPTDAERADLSWHLEPGGQLT
jgi:ABC-type lipoprotein export system ATPase subunit